MLRTWIFFAAAVVSHAATLAADSSRGMQLFQTLDCVQCHSINGQGGNIGLGGPASGKVGPDLARRIDRGFTPATLAATMWNHAPAMWSKMTSATPGGPSAAAGKLDEQAAQDLFAYFYSVHFFDQLGDAGRGKQIFSTDHCSACHGLTDSKNPEAKPVSQWTAIGDPIQMVDAMWNHAATMREEFAKRKIKWPQLSAQDLADLLVWVRNLPVTSGIASRLEITAGANGQALFASKGCAACHTGENALGPKLKGDTLIDIAVAMWNHEPKMASPAPQLQPSEMREVVSSLWAGEFFSDSGNASAGERVFQAKHCSNCHSGSGTAPRITGQSLSGATMVSLLWRHGPQMLDQMKAQGVAWPRFEGADMANLIAYLNKAK